VAIISGPLLPPIGERGGADSFLIAISYCEAET
jgi:hypothetical protein